MRSDFKDSAYTINKMIQFGTVKYGIVKQLKDRSRSDRDVTSDQEENGSPSIPCSPVLNCKSISPEIQQTMFDHQNEDHNHNNNNSSENHDDDQRYSATNSSPLKPENVETQSDKGTNNRVSSSSLVYSEEREEHNELESEIRLQKQRKNSPQQSPLRVANLSLEKVKTLVYNDEEDQNMSNTEDDNAHTVTHEQNLEEDREQVCLQLRHNSHLHSIHPKVDNHSSIENISFGNELSTSPPTLPQFPAAPVTLEAIQNMQMAIAQFAAKTLANGGADNEAAMKQLAFLQQTLFNLQQQQLFQIQLIQQLQSQLAMNQMKEGEDGNEEQNEKYDALDEEDKHCMEILLKPNSEEQNHKTVNENMDVEIRQSSETVKILEDEDEDIKDENESLNNKQQECEIQQEQKLQKEKEVQKKQLQQQIRQEEQKLEENRRMQKDLLLSLPKQDENTPLPFGSDLASSIITNHDNPPSLDEPNSLEMLQKRAQEVLESASQGILAGNLADEFAFGKDKSGDGKNRNEPFFKHRCRYCGKVFGSDSALQIHIRSHTGERPFKCNVCGSRFTTKGNLKVHFQRHAQKFPHVPMNATPIPEHLDKFHPPLLEQMSPETSPQHQPQMPHPNVPVPLPLPFPHGAGFPGLPLYRPPLEILKTLGAPYPTQFFGPVMPPLPPKRDQEMPTDLRKPIATPDSPKFKEETKDERISLRVKEEEENESANTTPRRSKSLTPPPPPLPLQQTQQQQSQEQSQLHQQLHQQHQEHQQPPLPPVSLPEPIPPLPQMPPGSLQIPTPLSIDELHDRLPLNFARSSPERRSPIRSPASIPRSPFLGPLKHEMALIPRPHSNDNSWENFIEVSNTSETVKLKELMKNKKLTDPNQCVVCDRVLSCKSALQMHYRTHTGERPFKCRICGRAFTTKGNLKTHMAVHKIRPPMRNFHQCPVCHKKYSNALVLQQHIRLHTGEPTDLTPEQIQAAEIRDFPPSMMPGSFLNPFAFNFGMPGHNGTLGSESSQGDNDDNMDCSDDFDDDISDHISNGDDLDRPKSGDEMKGMLFEQKLKIENTRPKSEASISSAPTSPISNMNKSSPSPSDISQGALDLTPKSIATISQQPPPAPNPALIPTRPPFGLFPNIPLFPPVSTTTQNMCSAMNSIAQSVMPSAPFNPLALSGVRGSTTCGICFKTFPCHSALEIHYRSHTKERPFKCSICDRGFTTKGNLKQHMLTHKIRDMEQDAYRNRAVKYMSGWKEGFE